MSFTASTLSGSKPEQYAQLAAQARALVHGEPDRIAKRQPAHWSITPARSWVGFYSMRQEWVVLPACRVRAIALDKALRAAVRTRNPRLPMLCFPGHIAAFGIAFRIGGAAVHGDRW